LVGECRNLLLSVTLHVNIQDRWVWILEPADGYTVSGAYPIHASEVPHHYTKVSDLIWHQEFKMSL